MNPFNPDDPVAYREWRARKLAAYPADAAGLVVAVADPFALTPAERAELVDRCARANMAVYVSGVGDDDSELPRALGRQLGLTRLDHNYLADDDGVSGITVARPGEGTGARGDFIPYTNRPIRWHTDGYYNPPGRRIRAMLLHCVRRAREGGENTLLDHEIAYLRLRDGNPEWIRALMLPDAMTIPAREDADGVARPAETGPVFSIDAGDGSLHMRYTARTKSIEWKRDPAVAAAVAALARVLDEESRFRHRLVLEPGMGIVCNNVLHERTGFVDDPAAPRLLYRARYFDRVAGT
jgi:alpha-ketoglutarate-dependent taurine dioxygenase